MEGFIQRLIHSMGFVRQQYKIISYHISDGKYYSGYTVRLEYFINSIARYVSYQFC